MTVKQYLSQAFLLDRMIQGKIALSDTLNQQALQCARDAPGKSEIYARIRELEADINADIDRLVDLKRELYLLIEKVRDPRERTILQLRYLSSENGKRLTWAHIAKIMCYDERWIMRLHVRALESAEKIWQMTEKSMCV